MIYLNYDYEVGEGGQRGQGGSNFPLPVPLFPVPVPFLLSSASLPLLIAKYYATWKRVSVDVEGFKIVTTSTLKTRKGGRNSGGVSITL